ncbi:hypothetical protein ZWY2020_049017 [Hordeum vulgare]|nr:hypothetical protein ZWY2020_049017 [Hordeum vulgare]
MSTAEPSVELDSSTSLEKTDSDPGSYSSDGLPKIDTTQRKKLNSDEEDSDFVPEETLAPPKDPRKTVRKEYTKPVDLRAPESARESTTLSTDKLSKKAGVKRPRKRTVHLVGRNTSMYEYHEEDAGEYEIPAPPKKKKLMEDAMKYSPKPPSKANKDVVRRKTTKDILAATKDKGPPSSASAVQEVEDENAPILGKHRPTLRVHNAAHQVAEDVRKSKDACLMKWRVVDPYAVRRRTVVDPRFHTKEQQDFYETVLFDKSPAVSDMRTAADQERLCGYAPYIQMLINAKLGKHAYLLDHPHLPLQPEFEDNAVVMDENYPNLATTRMAAEAGEAEAARNRPPRVGHLKNQAQQMAFLVSSVQGMEKNIPEILQSQKSLERVVETKFHDMDVKVTGLTTIVKQCEHEVDSMEIPCSDYEDGEDDDEEESSPLTATRFSTQPRSAVVPTQETR